jgi:hypothetical protein
MAFLMIFWLSLVIVTIVVVGTLNIDPRVAALFSMIPATLLGICGASYAPTRKFFSAIWIA